MFVQNIENRTRNFYIGFGKRAFDITLSMFLLIILSPLFIILSLLVKTDSEGPVFFTHSRIGKNGKAFKLYKFRTMKRDSEAAGPSVTSLCDTRITAQGKYLRKYKLDELPQLLNVLMGDMSIVGPRPEAEKYINEYKEDYSIILQIQPGLTDYAAIRFRNEEEILSRYKDVEEAYINEIMPDKVLLYKKYINEMSFRTDLKIVFKTLVEVIKA